MTDTSIFNTVFDAFFSGALAYNQIGFMVGGFIMVAVGLMMLISDLHWRITAQRIKATIIGVQRKGGCYHPVYEYIDAEGKTCTARDNSGSSLTQGKETGRICDILVLPTRPGEAQQCGFFWQSLCSLIFLLPGALFFKVAFQYPLTPMTGVFAVALFVWMAFKIKPHLKPRSEWGNFSEPESRKRRRAEKDKKYDPLTSIDVYIAEQNTPEKRAELQKNAKIAAPVCLLFSIGLLYGSYYKGMELQELSKTGLKADGQVVSLFYESSGDSSAYYPKVEFRDQDGGRHVFKDRSGSNPASYDVGEKVRVLYSKRYPKDSAMIDHGAYWNWVPSILMALGGLGILWLAWWNFNVLRRAEDV